VGRRGQCGELHILQKARVNNYVTVTALRNHDVTDGAQTMGGKTKGLKALIKSASLNVQWTHCHTQRSATPVLTAAISVVNFIKTRSLKASLFSALCEEMGAESLAVSHEARWLSRRNVLSRVFELRDIKHQSYDGICHTGKYNTIEIVHILSIPILFCKEKVDSVYHLFYLCNVTHAYIIHCHPFILGSGRRGSRPSRLTQTSFSPATLSSSFWGIPRRSQASREI